jgi:Mn2+/Fe2+ NRAMP family transporter
MKAPSRLSSVILWSVISAAFIGPGTITTAVSAGSHFQTELLWAIVFSTIACLALQEIAARIAIASGLTFGQAIEKKFGKSGLWLKIFIGASVVLGCAAYEAGNMLGAVSGISLFYPGDAKLYTFLIAAVAVSILWSGRRNLIFRLMTLLVALMGVSFIMLASDAEVTFVQIIHDGIVPSFPLGAEMLTLGLVGTTIVPYNLFLSSGISKGQTVPLMRIGLCVSVVIGGIITAFILLAGTLVPDFTSFSELAVAFEERAGRIGTLALAMGLFAAGFSSTITAPYAASVIGSTVFDIKNASVNRIIWMMVILTGFVFGVSDVKPIPVILTVQALNGLILPLVTAYLIIVVNDRNLIPIEYRHSGYYNIVLLVILGSVLLIGLNNVDRAISSAFDIMATHLWAVGITTGITVAYVGFLLIRKR